jgi:hypothetical protein
MTPLEFLNLLWRGKPDALFLLLWLRDGKKSHWFRGIEAAAEFIHNGHNRDVYIGVGLSPSDNGDNRRCKSDEVAGIAGVWADFDLRSAAHANKALPGSIEDALTIIPPDLPPTITVATGNGVHAWWLFEKPWIFGGADERKNASALSTRFQTLLQYNSNQRGWAFDKLSDLARVLRIPGTVNAKDPGNPRDVEVYSIGGRRYTPDQIRKYLDSSAIPDSNAEEGARKELERRFSDSPLVVNLHASISEDLLSEWSSRDPRFRRTWDRERDDMADQSGSGYDLALACFGVRTGLTDQQIVDVIVYHRRMHGDQQRTRVDYFQRTIAKARKAEVASAVRTPTGQQGCPDHLGEGDGADGAGALGGINRRAQLCDQLSSLLGVRILRLQKVPGSEPVYLMELENGRIEFDIARLTTQRTVKLALAGRAGKVIPTFKARPWLEITQMMLDACAVVDATDDLQFEGAARIHLHKYLSDNPVAPAVDRVIRRDILKPVIFKGQVTVHTTDLAFYLSQTAKSNASVQRLAGMLTAIGASAVRIREGLFGDQSRWGLPVDQFPPDDYLHPDTAGEAHA